MIRRVAGVVLAGIFAVFLGAGTAWAHGGPIELQVQGDGGQGVNVTVTYVRDHHMVAEEVRLTYTAVSGTGETVGPVPLVASNEGQAFYRSKEPLPVGNWTVTVTATHPSPATTTIGITSAALAKPAAPPVSTENPTLGVFAIVVPVLLAAAALTVAFAVRRRKSRVA